METPNRIHPGASCRQVGAQYRHPGVQVPADARKNVRQAKRNSPSKWFVVWMHFLMEAGIRGVLWQMGGEGGGLGEAGRQVQVSIRAPSWLYLLAGTKDARAEHARPPARPPPLMIQKMRGNCRGKVRKGKLPRGRRRGTERGWKEEEGGGCMNGAGGGDSGGGGSLLGTAG